ncbi:hypothetical protein ACOMHN_016572 [Nucella lapillus]
MPENPILKQYWQNRVHFTIVDDLLLLDERIVIPRCLRIDTLNRLHEGNLGITKCSALAKSSVWWLYITAEIEEMINKCHTCAIHRPEQKEPLKPSSFPEQPWSRLGMDLFDLRGKTYLLIVDYYSRWVEIKPLPNSTSAETINQTKSVFAAQGIPDVVVSDNGPQFASEEFKNFASSYGFTHVTSSPRYPQSNGEAERAVRTIKTLLKKNKDPYIGLLMYRASPLQNGLSPAELLMGRKLRTRFPVQPITLNPHTPDHETIMKKETRYKEQQQANFNQRHAARDLPSLQQGDRVWLRDLQRPGQVVGQHNSPRSYIIETPKGTVRRNRAAIVATPSTDGTGSPDATPPATLTSAAPPRQPDAAVLTPAPAPPNTSARSPNAAASSASPTTLCCPQVSSEAEPIRGTT